MNTALSASARRRLAWLAIVAAAFGLARIDSAPLERFTSGIAQARLLGIWSATPGSVAAERARCAAQSCAVARLTIPGQRIERIVLSHADGRAPSGGWGHRAGTPLPAAAGNTVFRVHRRADARLLQALALGDALVVELLDGRQFVYQVDTVDTAGRRQVRVVYDTRAAELTLISRHPDNPGLRHVVRAKRISAPLVADLDAGIGRGGEKGVRTFGRPAAHSV
jgi:sortase (surface protein transpeptidase)